MPHLPATGGRDVHTVRFPVGRPPATVDVLIVGAGPVGLAAATELTARGIRVAVVDRARTATLVRAGAMGHTPRVVEHFRRWGLLQRIREAWTYPPEWNRGTRLVTALTGHELVPVPRPLFRGSGAPEHTADEALRRPQTVLQQVFLDHLAEHGVGVAGGWELQELAEDGEGVGAGVVDVDSGERRTVRAAYVLGTDGGSSTTRRLAGIDREGDHATEKRLRLIVRTGDISARVGPAPSATNIVLNQRASGFLAAVSTREWRVYAGPYPLDHEPAEDELLAIGRAAFGFDLDLELVSATTFYHATRIATTFRRGRVLLAGDAAHVRTPGGNLGEGIGDVANLGWKLAAVLAGHAPDTLLDSYDQERRPHNWRVADHSLERSRRSQAALAEIRAGGIPDDADLGDAAVRRRAEIGERLRRDHSGGAGVTFDERYDASDVIWYEEGQLASEPGWRPDVYEDDPRPGHRAPDGRIDPHGSTLHDRIGTSFALLVLTGDSTGRPAEVSTEDPTGRPAGDSTDEPAGRPAGDLIRDRAVVDAFTRETASRSLPLTVIHLTDPDARAVYGAAHVLIRPDQHVAWRGSVLPDGGARAVLDRVLGRARSGTAAQALGAVPAQRVL